MPQSSAPGTRRAISTAVSTSATIATTTGPAVQVAQRDQRARRGDDETGPLQTDGRDQQSNPRRDRMFDRGGDRRNQPFAQPDAGGQHEDEAGDRNAAQRDAPRHLHADDHGVGEEEVVPHRRRDRDRIVREQRHQDGRERRRQTGGGEHGAEIHARRAQHRRLHEDDVGHRQKRRQACQHLRPHGGAVGGQREAFLQQREHGSYCRADPAVAGPDHERA